MRKLGRYTAHRISLFKNLCVSLALNKRIVTTIAKAKDLRSVFEKLVTTAKIDSLHSTRKLLSKMHNNMRAVKSIYEIGKEMIDRPGGYTRIIKIDNERAIIELVSYNLIPKAVES